MPHVFVLVKDSSDQPIAITRTNNDGRYVVGGLPRGRLVVEASKPGFLTVQAGGRDGSRIIFDCSTSCAQENADFELVRGASISGVVFDELGQPVPGGRVVLRPRGSSLPKAVLDITDDRGQFRIAGLSGGSYILSVQARVGADGAFEPTQRTVEIAVGQHMENVVIRPGGRSKFRIDGRLTGVPFGDEYHTRLTLEPLDHLGRTLSAGAGPEGTFAFDSVPEGRYLAEYTATNRASFEQSSFSLGVVEVLGDMTGVSLQPAAMASVSGRIQFAGENFPAQPIVQFTSNDRLGSRWSRVSRQGGEFKVSGLLPGRYRVGPRSAGFYVKTVKAEGALRTPENVPLEAGTNEVTIFAAADFGRVRGVVYDPASKQPLPHARVVLQAGQAEMQTQADQTGAFFFGEVVPGSYRICAWDSISPEAVASEANWERAGCDEKFIPVDPDSDTEIELGAAP